MASQLKPEISLGAKAPQTMSISDLLGTATKAVEFQRLSELYPALIKKTETESAAAELGLAQKQLQGITSRLTSAINNPLVVKAEQDPNSVDQTQLIGYLSKAGMDHAKALGIDEKRATQLLAPLLEVAQTNPGMVRNALKEQLIMDMDSVARSGILGGAPAIGVPTIPPNQPAFRPRGVTPSDMTAPMGAVTRPEVSPVAPPATVQQPIEQGQTAPAQPVVAIGGPTQTGPAGFQLPYEPPRPGVPRATLPSEASDLIAGQKYRQDLISGQQAVPKAMRNVDAVMQGVKELEKDRRFTTGKPQEVEKAVKEFFGDERFKQLSKDIANVELAVLQASGGSMSTDAGKALVAKANGDETYPPSVLISVARRLVGDLTRIDMEAQGAQKFVQQFGDSNLPAFRQAWAQNSDQKIFEAIAINKNERDPKRRKEALDKLLPSSREELSEFLNKYENIQKLTQTGRLR